MNSKMVVSVSHLLYCRAYPPWSGRKEISEFFSAALSQVLVEVKQVSTTQTKPPGQKGIMAKKGYVRLQRVGTHSPLSERARRRAGHYLNVITHGPQGGYYYRPKQIY